MRFTRRRAGAILAGLLIALAPAAVAPATAAASKTQIAIFEDDPQLLANPAGTLATFRSLASTWCG